MSDYCEHGFYGDGCPECNGIGHYKVDKVNDDNKSVEVGMESINDAILELYRGVTGDATSSLKDIALKYASKGYTNTTKYQDCIHLKVCRHVMFGGCVDGCHGKEYKSKFDKLQSLCDAADVVEKFMVDHNNHCRAGYEIPDCDRAIIKNLILEFYCKIVEGDI